MNDGQPIQLDRREAALARGAALKLLAMRSRSIAEMQERLARRFQPHAVEQTVARLVEEGLLDDADFAEQWRQSRERRRPRSRGTIERELRQRGVSSEIASSALEGFDSLDAAYRAAYRYAARQDASNRATFDRRVSGFLGRRGFEPSVIRQTLDRLRDELQFDGPGTDGAQDE